MAEKVDRFIELQRKVNDKARSNIEKAQERQKRIYDDKHNAKTKLRVKTLNILTI